MRPKKNRRKIDYREHETGFPELPNTASASECTGLMHRTPVNESELEAYRSLTPMQIPEDEESKNKSPNEKPV